MAIEEGSATQKAQREGREASTAARNAKHEEDNKRAKLFALVVLAVALLPPLKDFIVQEWREWRASSTASTSSSEVLRKEWKMKKDEVVYVPKNGWNCLTPSKRGRGERVVEDVGNSVKITAKEATNFVTWQYRATDVEHCNIALEELEARGKIH